MWLTLVTGGAFATSLAVAQTSSPGVDPTSLFTQLGIASIVCALLFAWGWTQSRQCTALLKQNEELRDAMLARERELSNGVVPLLAQAVETLRATPTAIKETLNEAQRATGQSQTDATVKRLEAMVERLSGGHGP